MTRPPLTWENNCAQTSLGTYRIMRQVGTGLIVLVVPVGHGSGFHECEAEAQAAAQAHYDSVTRPTP